MLQLALPSMAAASTCLSCSAAAIRVGPCRSMRPVAGLQGSSEAPCVAAGNGPLSSQWSGGGEVAPTRHPSHATHGCPSSRCPLTLVSTPAPAGCGAPAQSCLSCWPAPPQQRHLCRQKGKRAALQAMGQTSNQASPAALCQWGSKHSAAASLRLTFGGTPALGWLGWRARRGAHAGGRGERVAAGGRGSTGVQRHLLGRQELQRLALQRSGRWVGRAGGWTMGLRL